MGRRSFFHLHFSEEDRASGRHRLLVPGNQSSCHPPVNMLSSRPSPGAATGWHISEPRLIATYGGSRCRLRERQAARRLGSLPPHVTIRLHNILLMASGLRLNQTAVESIASGTAMRTAPTARSCYQEKLRFLGPRGGRTMGNVSPSSVTLRGRSRSMLSA